MASLAGDAAPTPLVAERDWHHRRGAALAGKAEFPVNKKAGMLRLLNGLMLFDSRVTQAGLLARTDPAGHHVAQRGIEFCADDLRSFALGS
jgi:hypothetical protein